MENIEIKKAYHINYEGVITETTGFQIETEGSYNTVDTTVYYKGKKAWIKASWGDNVVFTEEEARQTSRKRKEELIESLKSTIASQEDKIKAVEEELSQPIKV